MARKKENPETGKADVRFEELRRKAEGKLKVIETELATIPVQRIQQLVHELHVHQIELEMQNEELRRAQEEIEESRSRYSYLYDFAPIGYFTYDQKGTILEVNLTGAKQLGYERTNLVGRPFAVYVQNRQVHTFHSHLKKVFESGEKQTCEVIIRGKNDSQFSARLESRASERNKNVRCLTAVMDITEIKKVEEEILESKKINEMLLDNFPHPAMLIRQDRIILAANRVAREMGARVGKYCWKEFMGAQFIPEKYKLSLEKHPDKIPPGELKCVFCLADESLSSKVLQQCEVNAFNKIWDVRWIPVKDDTFLHYAMDITDRKKKEEALKHLTEELKRSNVDLEQFAYAASHDLREPLRTISAFLRLLEKRYKGKLDEKADEYISFTIESATRMDTLLTDLLEFSRLGSTARKTKPVNCAVALEKAIYDLGSTIEESGAQITYDQLPIVMANELQITRLFQNLLANSIKFRSDKKPKINISAKQERNQWLFSVRDNGIGIDPEFSQRIFVVFQRLHTRHEYEGMGMGLAMCEKIVKLHGGRIWVESEVGKGATFYFTLPVMQAQTGKG